MTDIPFGGNVENMTDAEIDAVLDRFDQTEPGLQRRIIAACVLKAAVLGDENRRLRAALAVFADPQRWDMVGDDFEWCGNIDPIAFARRGLEGK